MRKKNKQKLINMKEEKQEENKLSDVLAKVKSSDDNLTPYSDMWVRFYKLYRNYIDKDKWPTKSKMFNPLAFSLIETQTAKMMASKPAGEWKPATPGAKGDPVKINLAFDKWWQEEKALLKSQDAFKKVAMYGGASAQLYWKFKKGFKLGKPFVEVNRPSIRILRLEDRMFGFDPEADNFDDIKWSFLRYPITKKELEDLKESPLAPAFTNLDKAIASFDTTDPYKDDGLMQERKNVNKAKVISDETIKKAECIYLENYETGDCLIVVGRKHIIQDKKNPYLSTRSVIFSLLTRIPSEIIGMGDIEPIESLQHGANLFRNQRADNIDGILKPQWLTADKDVDDDELSDEQSLVIHCQDINKVKPLPKENVSATAYKEDEVIKNDIYAATSITPFSMGNDNDIESDRSGVAIGKLQNASDARVKAKMINFEMTFVKEVAEKWQRLMAQFQRETITVDDSGETIEITPEDLGFSEDGNFGEWNFSVEAGSTQHVNDMESREDYLLWQKNIIDLAKLKQEATTQPIPQSDPMTGQPIPAPVPPQILDYDKMAERLSEKFGQKNWREVWMIEEPLQPVEGDMLPGIDAQGGTPVSPMDESQGEMLPNIDMSGGEMLQNAGEMLPSVESSQEMLPSVDQQQEMLPPVEQSQGEMLPPVAQKEGFFQKVKKFFKGNKSKGEMLPPLN